MLFKVEQNAVVDLGEGPGGPPPSPFPPYLGEKRRND